MLTIAQADLDNAGGFLAALTSKSCEYISSLLGPGAVADFGGKEVALERFIVHASPHIDEYCAEMLFRACLPQGARDGEFLEQSLFSSTNDLACQHLWPTAAVFGIGRAVSGGVLPLFLFDEHLSPEDLAGTQRTASSCSQLVADTSLRKLPNALAVLLTEVNAIDEFGKASQQSVANLIKVLHEVRFAFQGDPHAGQFVSDTLTPEWKRAIVDAAMVAVVYCLQENIDLIGNPAEKKAALLSSLDAYAENSSHRQNTRFDKALQFLRSTYGDQAKVFAEAVLRNLKGPIADAQGNAVPQLMILSRVCFALERCWGENIRNIVATHFWEVAMQGQLTFYPVEEAVSEMFARDADRLRSGVGFLRRKVLPPIDVGRAHKAPVWLVSISPENSFFLPNKGIMNFINENNSIGKDSDGKQMGCGLVLVQDSLRGTAALFKCSGVPETKWRRLVDLITSKEGECWHVTSHASGAIAPYILNGNRAHQYVPRTGLDLRTLTRLVQQTFY